MMKDILGSRAKELLKTTENQIDFLQYLEAIYVELNSAEQAQLIIDIANDSVEIENQIFEWLALTFGNFK